MVYNIIICEDEPLFLAELKNEVDKYFDSVGATVSTVCCSSAAQFVKSVGMEDAQDCANRAKDKAAKAAHANVNETANPEAISLIFMDISLGDGDGMKLIENYRERGGNGVPVIFVSSMEDRVLEGYEVSAFAFLYKRNYKDKLENTLNRFVKEYSASITLTAINSGNMEVLSLNDIYYIESDGRKTLIHKENGDTIDDRGIGVFIKEVPENMFLEVYKCIYVNVKHISRINDDTVSLENGTKVMMSRRKRKPIMNAVMRYIGSR